MCYVVEVEVKVKVFLACESSKEQKSSFRRSKINVSSIEPPSP
jgi:hypothetical protein